MERFLFIERVWVEDYIHTFLKVFTASYNVEDTKMKHILYFNNTESSCIISHVLAFPVNREISHHHSFDYDALLHAFLELIYLPR